MAADNRGKTFVLSNLIWPAYRLGFLEELDGRVRAGGDNLVVYDGQVSFDPAVRSTEAGAVEFGSATNRYLFGRRLVVQTGSISALVRADAAVVQFTPRILSNWVVIALRRARRRPTLVWGHAWRRSGRRARWGGFRNLMRWCAGAQLTYTEAEAAELRSTFPWLQTRTVPNALYKEAELSVPAFGSALVYVGRLADEKRVNLLVEAYALATQADSRLGELRIVGTGPEARSLKSLVDELGLGDRVHLLGPVSEPSELRQTYRGTFCAVSPGYVGLSATQAAGFGRPLIYPVGEQHAPEIVVIEGRWGATFQAGSAASLASTIVDVHAQAEQWKSDAETMAANIRRAYTVERMATGMREALLEFS